MIYIEYVCSRSAAIGIITLSLRWRKGSPADWAAESLVHPLQQAAGMIHVVARSPHERDIVDGLRRHVLLHRLLDYLLLSVAVLLIIIRLTLIERFFFEHLSADGAFFLGLFVIRRQFKEIVEVIRDELLGNHESGAEVALH